MKDILSIKNMRDSDKAKINSGISEIDLVYQASKAIYNAIEFKNHILIIAGTGNNGADCYSLALLLCDKYDDILIFIPKNKFSNAALYYYEKCISKKINIIIEDYNKIDFNAYNIIIEGIFGTGFKGDVKDNYIDIINKINESKAYKVSIDINSGLNGDNGLASLAVKSDITLAIGGLKSGYYLNDAKDYIKNIKLLDIGIKPIYNTYKLIDKEDIVSIFKERLNNTNKGTYGYTALIGGSIPYSGAIRLAYLANIAMRSGAGVLMLAVPNELANIIIPSILEATIYPLKSDNYYFKFDKDEIDNLMKRVSTIAVGMGLGLNDDIIKLVEYLLLNYDKKLIIDADGLNALAKLDNNILKNSKAKIILTPHLKEFSRLSNKSIEEIKDNPIELSMEYAKSNNVILLLKGPTTIITDGKNCNLVSYGNPGMATAGSGDVLSGILAGIISYNDDLLLAVSAGSLINGLAGDIAKSKNSDITMVSSDTVNNIKEAIEEIIKLR